MYHRIMRVEVSTRVGVVVWRSLEPCAHRLAIAPWGCDVRGRSVRGGHPSITAQKGTLTPPTSTSPKSYSLLTHLSSSYPSMGNRHDPPYESFIWQYRLITPHVSEGIDTIHHTHILYIQYITIIAHIS